MYIVIIFSYLTNLFFSERLFRLMTDLLITEGYASVGYEYINVDDCWLEKTRSSTGRLVPDRKRFPSGMKALADYVRLLIFLKSYPQTYANIRIH